MGTPKKLQIKLMSNSGELLNVVSCFSGQVSVFRANTQSDLRPYQRALCGSTGRERFLVVYDGVEYSPDQHTLIGFGEPPPHAGLTPRNYLLEQGLPEGTVDSLLLSYGLEDWADVHCSTLPPDQERRLRLLAAVSTPHKILVVNEPFEHISSHWRERIAELLVDHARTQNTIVVVTSLSYRPECWIDNDAVARVQVGESIQRTIGFGGASSATNNLMNQLKELIRTEGLPPEVEAARGNPAHVKSSAGVGAAAALAAVGLDHSSTATPTASTGVQALLAKLGLSSSSPMTVASAIAAVGIVGAAAFTLLPRGHSITTQENTVASSTIEQAHNTVLPDDALPNKDLAAPAAIESVNVGVEPAKLVAPLPVEPMHAVTLLDAYPPIIKASLIDTARGIFGDVAPSEPASESAPIPEPKPTGQGNLFKLLESASTNQPDRALNNDEPNEPPPAHSWNSSQAAQYGNEDEGMDEEARREAIRRKFLDAIRAAAERRQAAMDGGN